MPTHTFTPPEQRYTLLQLSDGRFLTCRAVDDTASSPSTQRLDSTAHCGDDACWLLRPAEGARKAHLVHHSGAVELFGAVVGSTEGDEDPLSDPIWELVIPPELHVHVELPDSWERAGAVATRVNVAVLEGPGSLPSEYLSSLMTEGFVVCPGLLGDRLLGRLRHDVRQMRTNPELMRVQGSGAPGDSHLNGGRAGVTETASRVDLVNCINASPNFARMATHPVMQHMLTTYLGTSAIRLAHAPAVGITKPLGLDVGPDGALVNGPTAQGSPQGGGWHVDYPLHDMQSPFPPEVVLGAQCNVCIDDFTVENSTNFIIGSHETRTPPPLAFNTSDNEHFPPFAPQVVDQIECPGGSLIMCAFGFFLLVPRSPVPVGFSRVRITTCPQITPTRGTDQA
eukprot:COSAG02_NODE_154_length_33067_cov_38.282092_20_plen_396_part_00